MVGAQCGPRSGPFSVNESNQAIDHESIGCRRASSDLNTFVLWIAFFQSSFARRATQKDYASQMNSIETIKAIEERSEAQSRTKKKVENLGNLLETARRWSYELLQRNET